MMAVISDFLLTSENCPNLLKLVKQSWEIPSWSSACKLVFQVLYILIKNQMRWIHQVGTHLFYHVHASCLSNPFPGVDPAVKKEGFPSLTWTNLQFIKKTTLWEFLYLSCLFTCLFVCFTVIYWPRKKPNFSKSKNPNKKFNPLSFASASCLCRLWRSRCHYAISNSISQVLSCKES